MKTLSLNKPLIIMMLGIPGAGKSTFTNQFSDMFNAPLVSGDRLRQAIFDKQTYSTEEDALVSTIMGQEIAELMKTQKTFIIDGDLSKRVSRMAIERQSKKYGYDTLTIWVQTDVPTAQMRATVQRGRGDNSDNTPMTEEMFVAKVKRFTAPPRTENYIVISGKHTFATQIRAVLKKLVGPRDVTLKASQRDNPNHTPTGNNNVPPTPKRRSVTIN